MAERVTVFGGSRPIPGDPAYGEALRLGELLGRAGYTVMSGGYVGVMEAVSRGAAEAGAHVVGVTCADIERWRPVRPNAWVQEEWRCQTLHERLQRLIGDCQAALALPGGPGTLTEIALMWNLLLTESIPAKPMILIGPGWRATIDSFFGEFDAYIPSRQRTFLSFAANVDAAVEELQCQLRNERETHP